jgi:rhamnosyl/mannosyltransferase
VKALHFGRFHNDNFGGIERHVSLLLSGLSRVMQVDNVVANETFSSCMLAADGYRVYKVPSLGIFAGMALCPTMPWRALSLHRQEHYNIIHLHFPDPMSHVAALALPQDMKLVISWHSDIIRQQNLLKLYQPFMNSLVARADAIVAATPAHFTSSTQLEAADLAKRRVVPYGVDFALFDDPAMLAAGRALREQYGRPIIFAVGRHVYYKGFEYLIRAMRHVQPDALLLLGGSGPLFNVLKAQAITEGVVDRIRFLGRIPETQLPAYYHAAEIFCMPSVEPSEAFGMVQVEAMICRKPVVCCELKNGTTYVNRHGETGFVVAPRDSIALAEAVNVLLSDTKLRAALGVAGRARVENEFTLEHMRKGMLVLYHDLCAN